MGFWQKLAWELGFGTPLHDPVWAQASALNVPVLLKGHCHAIWQPFKRPGVFASIEFQN